jgi:imidazolonepropionase-like amidohydrolase
MLTAPRGYPTQSWGKNGFGAELSTPDAARTLVHQLFAKGARFAKLSFDGRYPLLQPEVARAASEEARTLGMKVAAHALDADAVARALDAGIDILAHTPREELPAELLYKLNGKWVISTLRAFAVDPRRLAALREAGMRIAYGTDLGNEGTSPRIDAGELELLREAGVDPLKAATVDAAELCGFADLGRLEVGFSACVLSIGQSLARPERVVHCGKVVP